MPDIDTSPAALRALADHLCPEPGVHQYRDGDLAHIVSLLRALAAEKEAPSAAIDAVLRDAMASGIGIARIAPEEFSALAAEKAEAERGKLIMALDHLLYPKPASGTRVYTLPDGQRECLTAKQFHEACARHLLQTLATQDLLAMAPGVETAPANPEDPAHG